MDGEKMAAALHVLRKGVVFAQNAIHAPTTPELLAEADVLRKELHAYVGKLKLEEPPDDTLFLLLVGHFLSVTDALDELVTGVPMGARS